MFSTFKTSFGKVYFLVPNIEFFPCMDNVHIRLVTLCMVLLIILLDIYISWYLSPQSGNCCLPTSSQASFLSWYQSAFGCMENNLIWDLHYFQNHERSSYNQLSLSKFRRIAYYSESYFGHWWCGHLLRSIFPHFCFTAQYPEIRWM